MLQTMRKTSDLIWQDAQHQALFETLDLIKRPGTDSKVLLKLKDYTENHFSLEERYMVELGYPGRKAHIEAHNLFRIEIVQMVDCNQPDALVRELMAIYLTEWLKRHVFGIDKDLEDFILQSGSR
jgi:hemerythrin